jgi:hypothetical protein
MPDFIPRKDSELVAWSANFVGEVAAHATAWNIPEDEVTVLQAATASFASFHALADNPARNAVVVAEKNAAREDLIAKIRSMANFRLRNPSVLAADRIALGLRVRDDNPTEVAVPRSRPEIDINVVDFRRLSIRFHDMGSHGKAKPYGTVGATIAYATLDAPPADPSDLTRNVLATRTPHVLEFAEEERGRTVYVAICWQNTRGERGPWSEIESAIVP